MPLVNAAHNWHTRWPCSLRQTSTIAPPAGADVSHRYECPHQTPRPCSPPANRRTRCSWPSAHLDDRPRDRIFARNAQEWDQLVAALSAFHRIDIEAHHLDRAQQIQHQLANNGLKGRKVPDLLIAAVAEAASLTIVHYDAAFDKIATVTGQLVEWLVERGSIN